jgi:ribosome-associated protein
MEITDTLAIPDDELLFSFARSGGPGGQNVNKVASKAVLHWNLSANTTLPPDVKERLRAREANRITTEGELVIQSQRSRDQGKNIEDCRAKLREMVVRALHVPRPRRPTKPSKGSRQRRLADKKQQSQRKASRRRPSADE